MPSLRAPTSWWWKPARSRLKGLITAVNMARNTPGVVAISMSWGFNEFRQEAAYNSTFTTPAGHTGITFLAASGDSGSQGGAEWPVGRCRPWWPSVEPPSPLAVPDNINLSQPGSAVAAAIPGSRRSRPIKDRFKAPAREVAPTSHSTAIPIRASASTRPPSRPGRVRGRLSAERASAHRRGRHHRHRRPGPGRRRPGEP